MEDFVTFELAKKLKEKGFREECLLHYTNVGGVFSNSIDTCDRPNQELDYSDFQSCFNVGNSVGLIDAPTISQVLKWLREKQDYHVCIYYNELYGYEVICISNDAFGGAEETYDTYEEAALDGIEYVLDNLI